ncbi:hypothetical protein J6590_057415 [Homalodisca vitripennis]|nr:hypothetical protein J6590_057415 [Homalodisca vitripennis]
MSIFKDSCRTSVRDRAARRGGTSVGRARKYRRSLHCVTATSRDIIHQSYHIIHAPEPRHGWGKQTVHYRSRRSAVVSKDRRNSGDIPGVTGVEAR